MENNELTISSRFAKLKNIVPKFSPDLRAEKKELSCRIRFPEWKKMKFAGRWKGWLWGGGGTDLQILGFQMGVEEVQKTL